MAKKTLRDFYSMKMCNEPLAWTTAYDCCFAMYAEQAKIDMLLVGDSLGIFSYGLESTEPVTMELMLAHCRAVRNGAKNTYIVADLPFGSYTTPELAANNALRFIKEAGADAVKMEGGKNISEQIEAICAIGVTVVGHIGMPPSHVAAKHALARENAEVMDATFVLQDVCAAYHAGASLLVLENLPSYLCAHLHKILPIPVYSAGSGTHADGHLIAHSRILGIKETSTPSKQYCDIASAATQGFSQYIKEVKANTYEAPASDSQMPPLAMETLFSKIQTADEAL